MPRHFSGQRRTRFLHLGLDQTVPGFPHQWFAAEFGHAVIERLRRFHIGNNRGTGQRFQHRFGKDAQNLVAPDNAAHAIDRTDPVAVTVESQSEIELVVRDELFQVAKVFLFRGIGMMIGERAINFGKDRMMLAGEQLDEFLDDLAGCAIARVPADTECPAIVITHQSRDIIIDDAVIAD